jgi:predicted DCC family thiol-disulfide oxidoreductase YuxK
MDPLIVLFDGTCRLCDRSARFIVARDPRSRFRFATLQGETGRALLRARVLPAGQDGTLVLIEGEKVYIRSTAALRIARRLTFPWPLLSVLLLVPACLRDPVYALVARNRYRWFGRQAACRIPGPEPPRARE